MKLFKLMATTAITTMAVAAMSVSASAMTASYNEATTDATGSVTLGTTLTADGQRTLLVLYTDVFNDFPAEDATATASTSVTVSETDIVQIDQQDSFGTVVVGDLSAKSTAEQEELIKVYNTLADADKTKEAYDKLVADCEESATYYVRVGGAATIETAKFTVPTTATLPEDPSAEPEAPAYTLGDVTGNDKIEADDAGAVLNHVAKLITLADNALLAADTTGNSKIEADDAGAILNYVAKLISEF
jgi:hypothetical protein